MLTSVFYAVKSNKSLWLLLAFSLLLPGCSFGQADSRERSAHFKEGRFYRPDNKELDWKEGFELFWESELPNWPDLPKEPIYGPTPPERVTGDTLRAVWVNHSTVLLQGSDVNILVDPIYSERLGPVAIIGHRRSIHPGIPFEALPTIDYLLISHNHYDHLDLPTYEALIERDHPKVYLGLGVATHLDSTHGVTEMDWWEKVQLKKDIQLSFVPVRHFSSRSLTDRYATLWGAFVLEIGSRRVFIAPDAAYSNDYIKVREKYGPIDLAFLPIGAYEPRWFMKHFHMDPKEAVQAHLDLQSKLSVGIHFGTFPLTSEPIDEPVELLTQEREKAGVAVEAFITLHPGEPLILSEK